MKDELLDDKHEGDRQSEESDLKDAPLIDSDDRLGRRIVVITESDQETRYATQNSALGVRRHHELFGTPRVEATLYFCPQCTLPGDSLERDIGSDLPRV
jgi:hypothetical protein